MADELDHVGQQEIEDLLKQAKGAAQQSPAESATAETAERGAVRQDEIDSLLTSGGAVAGATDTAETTAPPPVNIPSAADPSVHHSTPMGTAPDRARSQGDDVQFLLDQAEQALASVDQPTSSGQDMAPFQLRDFAGSPPSEEKATLDLMGDVELDVQIELGRTNMYLDEVLRLQRGCVVALDKLAGDPVDIYVNGRLIARGEVLVLNDNFCVRVAELILGDDTD
ncbi:MAG: flagellar motor switch protein FliN [Pirellulaceae bacterium]